MVDRRHHNFSCSHGYSKERERDSDGLFFACGGQWYTFPRLEAKFFVQVNSWWTVQYWSPSLSPR
jgi:hypothetical protein